METGFFEEKLRTHLEAVKSPLTGNAEFIEQRAALAAEEFERVSRQGMDVVDALEESHRVLVCGLEDSFESYLAEMLEEEYPALVGYGEATIRKIASDSKLKGCREAYESGANGDDRFSDRLLYFETLGIVDDILKRDGYIQ